MTALHSSVLNSRGSRRPDRTSSARRKVARVGELPRQADRRVEAEFELVDRPAREVDVTTHAPTSAMPPAVARAVAYRPVSSSPAAGSAHAQFGCAGSEWTRPTTVPVLQERQLPGAEVVEQRAERFGPQRHLRVQPPGGVEIERRCRGHGSVHPAHAVDRHLFDSVSRPGSLRRVVRRQNRLDDRCDPTSEPP